MSENKNNFLRKIIMAKIKKWLLGLIGSYIVPIFLFIITFVVVVGGVSMIFDSFAKFFNGTPTNESQAMKDWANGLTDEEVKKMMENGSTINPKMIPSYIDIEKKGIPSDLTVQMKIKTDVRSEDGDVSTNITTKPYTLKLANVAYPYRLQWKFLAGLDVIDPTKTTYDITKKDLITKADAMLQPKFVWAYDKYSKDVTDGVQQWETYTVDGDSTTTHSETLVTNYYPLEYLKSVTGTFADYSFKYDENITTKDTGWVEVSGSRSTFRWKTGGNAIIGADGKPTGETTPVVRHSRTTWSMTRQIVVEDIFEDVVEVPRLERVTSLFQQNKIDLQDLNTLYEIIAQMPDTSELQEQFGDLLALELINDGSYGGGGGVTGGIGNSGVAGIFNPNIPIINGVWTRADLLKTAMSIQDLWYFWGGKYPKKGENPSWGQYRTVFASGNWSSGTQQKLGLDCSGYVDWTYYQMTGKVLGKGGGASSQYWNCYEIKESELKVGDLGVYQRPTKSDNNAKHIGIYVGEINGKKAFIHAGGKYYKDASHPTGRVVISYLHNGKTDGGYYKGTPSVKFVAFVRPYVKFADDK
jgi:hypothetical protein